MIDIDIDKIFNEEWNLMLHWQKNKEGKGFKEYILKMIEFLVGSVSAWYNSNKVSHLK